MEDYHLRLILSVRKFDGMSGAKIVAAGTLKFLSNIVRCEGSVQPTKCGRHEAWALIRLVGKENRVSALHIIKSQDKQRHQNLGGRVADDTSNIGKGRRNTRATTQHQQSKSQARVTIFRCHTSCRNAVTTGNHPVRSESDVK